MPEDMKVPIGSTKGVRKINNNKDITNNKEG